ncbi:hypothetical protein [Streptomyces sp. NPDC058371]|uniref:hypothetical protein n=1 Tax=Streptomyces sp. NPDC058371 TaxID=3346463 RepID=UPI0036483E92
MAFWSRGTYTSAIPGLFDFRSATWGDGLLLPLLALCLRVSTRRLAAQYTPSHRWRAVVIGALMGVAVGAAVIVAWARDEHPVVNWTIPRAGELTAAGIWHAAFLVSACGCFAGLGTDVVKHLRVADAAVVQKTLTSSWACVAFACMAGYAWLAVADAERADATVGGRASLVAVTIGAVLVAAALVRLRVWRHLAYLSTLAVSSVLTLFTVVFVDAHPDMNSLAYASLTSVTASGLGLAATTREGSPLSVVEALGACGLFGTVTVYASTSRPDHLGITLALPLLAVAGAVSLRWLRGRLHMPGQSPITGEYGVSAGMSACLLVASLFATTLVGRKDEYITGGFILTIAGAVLGGVLFQYFKADYVDLMAMEGDAARRSPDGRPSRAQRRAATRVWTRMASYSVAAFSAILTLTIALAPSLKWSPGSAQVPWEILLCVGGVTAALVPATGRTVVIAWATADVSVPSAPERSAWPAWICAGGATVISIVLLVVLVRDGALNILALLQALVMMLFASEGIAGNGVWLHAKRLTKTSTATLVSVAVATGLITYWSMSSLVRPEGRSANVGWSLLAWACCALAVLLLMVTATATVYRAGGRRYRTDYPPVKGVMQDAFLLTILWMVLGWLPQTVLAHVPASVDERWAAIGTLLAGFMLTFCPPFLWTLENNDTHVCRQREVRHATAPTHGPFFEESSSHRISALPDRIARYSHVVAAEEGEDTEELSAGDFMDRLSGHTAVQNALALVLVVISVVGAVGVLSAFSGPGEPPAPPPS